MKEYILCAAIWYNDLLEYMNGNFKGVVYHPKNIETGFVVCGRRHHNIIQTVALLTGKPASGKIQGFLTNTDRFLDRNEALLVALEAGQVLNPEAVRGNQLYSEDLY